MHAVEHYELIRRKHFVDGMSQRAIAHQLGHSRKFVRKALEHPIPPGYRLRKPKPKPALDPVRPLIDAWLEEDLTRPVKQRHTAQGIYERLVAEEGFQGDASTIRRYVASWKEARNSGDATHRLGSITKQGSAMARFVLGQLVLHALRRDASMKAWYAKIKKRRGAKIARVAVMRRLATILWHMLKNNEPYVLGGPPRLRLGKTG